MSLMIQQLPAFQSVAVGQDALCVIPPGRKVHIVWLDITDQTGTTLQSGNLIGDIQVIVGSKTQRQVTGVQLNHINSVNDSDLAMKTLGVAGQPGYHTLIPICFADPSRKNSQQTRDAAWAINGSINGKLIDSLQIKVRLGAGLNTPVLSGWYEFEPSSEPLGAIVKYIRKTYPAIGSVIEDTKVEPRDLCQAVHFFNTSDGKFVSKLDRFVADGQRYREDWTLAQMQASLIARNLNPDVNVAPVFDCIWDFDDPVDQWLPFEGRRDLSFKLSLSAAAAGTMDVVFVRVGLPE
jgi:hypothetical protein